MYVCNVTAPRGDDAASNCWASRGRHKACLMIAERVGVLHRIIPAGTTATTDSITIPRAQNGGSITLNPDGVTLKSSPDSPSMTVCFLALKDSSF